MAATAIADNVWAIGVTDSELRVFDIIMETKTGTTYNSYLVRGEKAALIDGSKLEFQDEWFANIEKVMPLTEIEYLIVNHTEPDHSGSYPELLRRHPKIKIICAAPAVPFVNNVINTEADITGVKDNHELDLGGKKFIFKATPYMHWPDTMMEYLVEDKILFSCDGFAAHIGTGELYDDELSDKIDMDWEVKYYYDCIMRPFSGYIRRNLPKLDEFDIKMVAGSHGPIQRKEPRRYINQYQEWVAEKYDQDVAVVYASNYGNTGAMAKIIDSELQKAGVSTAMVDMTALDEARGRDVIERSRAVAIGTPTFNGDAVKPVWDFIGLFASVYSIGKKAAVFGSYGWGGEGIKLVADRLSGMKLKVYENQLRTRLVASETENADTKAFAAGFGEFVASGKK
ncbi:FprA family A-type flavoprotein [bacterium]|nr:FprA family A-type flavoprotein [bacterium]